MKWTKKKGLAPKGVPVHSAQYPPSFHDDNNNHIAPLILVAARLSVMSTPRRTFGVDESGLEVNSDSPSSPASQQRRVLETYIVYPKPIQTKLHISVEERAR